MTTEICQDCQTQPAECHITEIKERTKTEKQICKLCFDRRLRISQVPSKTEPGPDGFLWQLWEYDDQITLQRACDAEGCDKGLLYTPVRNCSACQGSGYKTRAFPRIND